MLWNTGQTCQVSGFHPELDTISNVPIATCATAYTSPTNGQTYILMINQALYFGNEMNHSLINPHQIRVTGVQLSDDTYDYQRYFGIVHPDPPIPFDSQGAKVYFNSRTPTDHELETCETIILTNDSEWDPQNVELGARRPMEEEDLARVAMEEMKTQRISTVSLSSQPPQVYETDAVLESISSTLTEESLNKRMVGHVHVKRKHGIYQVATQRRHSLITPEHVAQKWNLGLETAKTTLNVTTQCGTRQAIHPLHRRYRVDHLLPYRNRLQGQFYMDHLQSKVTSLEGYKGAFVYTDGKFTKVIPSTLTKGAGESLRLFVDDVGVPTRLCTDFGTTMIGKNTKFNEYIQKYDIKHTQAEKGRHNQNGPAEVEIRNLKRRWRDKMIAKDAPKAVWDYGLIHQAEIMSRFSRGHDKRTGYEQVTGETPDISEWLDFNFYDRVWYWDVPAPEMNKDNRQLARWLGVSHRVSTRLSYFILTQGGKIISRTSVQHITPGDLEEDGVRERIKTYAKRIKRFTEADARRNEGDTDWINEFVGDIDEDIAHGNGDNTPTDEEYELNDKVDILDVDDLQSDACNKYIGTNIKIETPDGVRRARVTKHARNFEGRLIGHEHSNPLLDTRQYDIEFEDGTTDRYYANVIAENIYSSCDEEGHEHLIFQEIIDHRKDDSTLSKDDTTLISGNGNRHKLPTTKGWKFKIKIKDNADTWVQMKYVLDSNPIELAEYAIAQGIANEPAFAWWVPRTLRKRERIIKKATTRYMRTTHKFGVELPKTVEEAMALDEKNGNTLWIDALKKEMSKVSVTFDPKEGYTPDQVRNGKIEELRNFQEINCHIIWDCKMSLERKA